MLLVLFLFALYFLLSRLLVDVPFRFSIRWWWVIPSETRIWLRLGVATRWQLFPFPLYLTMTKNLAVYTRGLSLSLFSLTLICTTRVRFFVVTQYKEICFLSICYLFVKIQWCFGFPCAYGKCNRGIVALALTYFYEGCENEVLIKTKILWNKFWWSFVLLLTSLQIHSSIQNPGSSHWKILSS